MGTCFGRCLTGDKRSSIQDDLKKNLVEDNNEPESILIFRIMKTKEKRHSKFIERFWSHKELSYSRLNKPSIQKSTDIPMQSLDAHSLLITNHDRMLQCFEHTGMNSSSPASSSLDLEWEHEYGNGGNCSWLVLPEDESSTVEDESSSADDNDSSLEMKDTSNEKQLQQNQFEMNVCRRRIYSNKFKKPSSSRTSWSHISTPESLEWDVDGDEHKFKSEEDLLDNETIELLHEIDWLKNRALNETGDNLRDLLVANETES